MHLSRDLPLFLRLERALGAGLGTEGYLPSRKRPRRPPSGSRPSRPLGQKISHDCRELETQLGTNHSLLSFAPEVRKIIYTTNAIESLHMQLRKVLKNRGHFPSDEAATKLISLALRNITKSWKNPPLTWRMAANQFAIQFGERFNK